MMMSKKYQNKNCVYCVDEKAEDGDHIIARQFIPVDKRAYLPKVPSCKKCNNIKSKLEIYLTTILPFGSNAPGAKEMLKTMVPARLENNFKLKKSLQVGAHNVWVKPSDSDIIQRSMTLPIEGEKLIELLRMIIRGLSFYHWKVVIPKNYRVDVYALPLEGLIHFRDKIEPNFFKENSVEGNIGDGCFQYIGAKHAALSTLSCWEMSFYDVHLTGSGQKIPGPLYFCGTIGPAEPVSKKDLSLPNI
jgi:hypothetical protein